jgi:hypothetical protein
MLLNNTQGKNASVQHSTAQHSTAQHSTAQYSTAQHMMPVAAWCCCLYNCCKHALVGEEVSQQQCTLSSAGRPSCWLSAGTGRSQLPCFSAAPGCSTSGGRVPWVFLLPEM